MKGQKRKAPSSCNEESQEEPDSEEESDEADDYVPTPQR